MGTYYYLKKVKPHDVWGAPAVYEDEYIDALFRIAKKHGVSITDTMIAKELKLKPEKEIKKRKKRVNLYVDGTNLFAGQNQLFGPKRFLPFSDLLSEIRNLFPIHEIFFYATYLGVQRKHSSFEFSPSVEAQFYREVKKTTHLAFFKGHRSPTSGKEKGVDVHLAVDMVKHALAGMYDEAILVTGDADLIYPLEVVQEYGLPVHAIFLPNRFSLEIAFKARSATILNYVGHFKPGTTKSLPEKLRIIRPKKAPPASKRGR